MQVNHNSERDRNQADPNYTPLGFGLLSTTHPLFASSQQSSNTAPTECTIHPASLISHPESSNTHQPNSFPEDENKTRGLILPKGYRSEKFSPLVAETDQRGAPKNVFGANSPLAQYDPAVIASIVAEATRINQALPYIAPIQQEHDSDAIVALDSGDYVDPVLPPLEFGFLQEATSTSGDIIGPTMDLEVQVHVTDQEVHDLAARMAAAKEKLEQALRDNPAFQTALEDIANDFESLNSAVSSIDEERNTFDITGDVTIEKAAGVLGLSARTVTRSAEEAGIPLGTVKEKVFVEKKSKTVNMPQLVDFRKDAKWKKVKLDEEVLSMLDRDSVSANQSQ